MSINLIYSVWKPFSDASEISRYSWIVYVAAGVLLAITSAEMKFWNSSGIEPRI
jgi:hypothetical protein